MLSFKEKRELQKTVRAQNEILKGKPSFSEKRNAQKTKLDALKKLGIAESATYTKPESIEPSVENQNKKVSVDELITTATQQNRSGNSAYSEYREVDDDEADALNAILKKDVRNYKHSIDESAIRHIIKEHGNSETELQRGQIAITAEDFKKIPEITNATTADSVEYGGKSEDGLDKIVYKKRYNGTIVVVEEVRNRRGKLALKTMWKIRAVLSATSNEGGSQTSETFHSQSSTGNPSIAQPPEKSTDESLETFTAEDLIPDGDDNMVKTAKGTKVSTGFAVVEASRLIVSHDNQGNENPEYPYELQPRDRKRAESVAWVLKTAKNLDVDSLGKTRRADSGAPIVGKDRVVESGNGRTMAIIEAYRIGEADEYRDWLIDEAQSFGLNPDKIKAMKKPVLVRVRKSKLDRVAFATEANQDDKLAMTATEKAKADANRLTPDLIAKLKDGDLTSASNRDFILGFLQSLGDTEAAQYSTTDGKPTKQIFDRVQAALFAHAYNNDRLLQLMADDAKPEIKNILNALNAASPTFIKAKSINEDAHSKTTAQLTDSIETSLDQEAVNTIISATNVIMDAKNKGLSIDELLSQEDMFGSNITPEIAAMALFIKDNNKSSTRLAMAFQEMASFIKSDLQSRQTNSLFGDDEPVSLVDVLKVANDKLKQIYGDNVKTIGGGNLGGFIDLFTETWGQKADREAFLAGQEPSVDSNVALLQDIAQGQYSHLNSEALLDMIEPAARAVDVASYATLINEAEDEWLKVDNRDYALDSVYREAS